MKDGLEQAADRLERARTALAQAEAAATRSGYVNLTDPVYDAAFREFRAAELEHAVVRERCVRSRARRKRPIVYPKDHHPGSG